MELMVPFNIIAACFTKQWIKHSPSSTLAKHFHFSLSCLQLTSPGTQTHLQCYKTHSPSWKLAWSFGFSLGKKCKSIKIRKLNLAQKKDISTAIYCKSQWEMTWGERSTVIINEENPHYAWAASWLTKQMANFFTMYHPKKHEFHEMCLKFLCYFNKQNIFKQFV